jgi:hypothetical protein
MELLTELAFIRETIGRPGSGSLADRHFRATGLVSSGSRRSHARFTQPGPPNTLKALFFLSAFHALSCWFPAIAQETRGNDANGPKYDLRTETKLKATVEEVKLPPKGREKEIAHLLGKIGTKIVDVYLCPSSFLNEIGVSFSKDEIAFTGSKVKQEGADLVLAREVVRGNDTLVLRDEKGNPVWSWQRKN